MGRLTLSTERLVSLIFGTFALAFVVQSCSVQENATFPLADDGLPVVTEQVECTGLSHDNAYWPIDAFVSAESKLEQGDILSARNCYRQMIEEAIDRGDEMSSISAFAFWRFLQLGVGPRREGQDVDFVVDAADQILKAGSPLRGLLSEGISFAGTSLSGFEAEIWSLLAGYAWNVGDLPRAAVYLAAARTSASEWLFEFEADVENALTRGPSDAQMQEIYRLAENYGLDGAEILNELDPASAAYRAANWLADQRRFEESVPSFIVAMGSTNASIRVRAGVRFADVMRRIGTPKGEILTFLGLVVEDAQTNWQTLDIVDIQAALIARARTHDRVPNRNLEAATVDLIAAADLQPPGSSGAESLYLLARLYEWEGELDLSREYYSNLRQFQDNEGRNERLESAYYDGAHLEYRDSRQWRAAELLEAGRSLTEHNAYGPFYSAIRFWLGRIYREIGRESEAVELLTDLANERPFDFYGLRARMHVNIGAEASKLVLLDPETAQFVRGVYKTTPPTDYTTLPDSTDPGLQRLLRALDTGVYKTAFHETSRLFESNESRFLSSDPVAVANAKVLVPLAIWRSLRHDVFRSSTLASDPRGRVSVATKLAESGDWSTVVRMMAYWGSNNFKNEGYLSASYPPAFRDALIQATAESDVSPVLLYGVIHAESRLSSRAISPTGAIGLLQFQPQTVRSFPPARDIPNWKLDLDGSLADPVFNILLGVRWFDTILGSNGDNIPLAVMEHNAGDGAVRRWFGTQSQDVGVSSQCLDDLELCIESARSAQTRSLVREVLTTMSIADAAGMFEAG